MKKYLLSVITLSILTVSNHAFAQIEGKDRMIQRQADALNSNNANQVEKDSDVSLSVKLEAGKYQIKIDGAQHCTIGQNLQDKLTKYSCSDNYDVYAKKYIGFFRGIWAYFEVHYKGSEESLADTEIKIGQISSPTPPRLDPGKI